MYINIYIYIYTYIYVYIYNKYFNLDTKDKKKEYENFKYGREPVAREPDVALSKTISASGMQIFFKVLQNSKYI